MWQWSAVKFECDSHIVLNCSGSHTAGTEYPDEIPPLSTNSPLKSLIEKWRRDHVQEPEGDGGDDDDEDGAATGENPMALVGASPVLCALAREHVCVCVCVCVCETVCLTVSV